MGSCQYKLFMAHAVTDEAAIQAARALQPALQIQLGGKVVIVNGAFVPSTSSSTDHAKPLTRNRQETNGKGQRQ